MAEDTYVGDPEFEDQYLQDVEMLNDSNPEWRTKAVPESFSCHEALHMVSFLSSAVFTEICEHPAIINNREWYDQAMKAGDLLAELYQKIGSKHIPTDETSP